MARLFSLSARVTDDNNVLCPGAKAYFYAHDSLSPRNTYTTYTLSVANTNPVVADAAGLLPPIYLDPTIDYRCIVKRADGSLIRDIDPLGDKSDPGTGAVRNGSVDPNGGIGLDGDFYINTTTWTIFGPKATTWPAGVSLRAPVSATLAELGVGDSILAGAFVTKSFFDLAATEQGASAINRGYWGNSWNYDWPGTGDGSTAASHTGTLIDNVASDAAALLAVSATARRVVAFAGRNGMVLASHSAATEYADFLTWLAAMVAAGIPAASIWVPTALPATDLDETKRTAYNAALVSGAGTHGYNLIRFDLDATMGVAGTASDTSLYLDGVHPTDHGHALLKTIELNAYAGIVPSSGPGPFTLTNQLNTTVTQPSTGVFRAEKTGGTAAWGDGAAVDATHAMAGAFIIRYTPQQANKNIFAGLSTAPATNSSFTDINGFNFSGSGDVDGTSYAANQNWFLKRDGAGNLTRGYGGTDGVTGFTSVGTASGVTATLYVKVAFYDLNGAIEITRLL